LCATIEQCPDLRPFGVPTVPDEPFADQPDAAVLDLDFQSANHRDLLRRLHRIAPDVKVCALAFRALAVTIEECLSMGASGFLLKDCSIDEVCRAIRRVAHGETFLDPKVAGALLKAGEHSQAPRRSALSQREVEVIGLIGRGLTNRQIANNLELSEKTVKNHVSHIFRKLKITARTQAALHAISHDMARPAES